jgi:hypothetical protein
MLINSSTFACQAKIISIFASQLFRISHIKCSTRFDKQKSKITILINYYITLFRTNFDLFVQQLFIVHSGVKLIFP